MAYTEHSVLAVDKHEHFRGLVEMGRTAYKCGETTVFGGEIL